MTVDNLLSVASFVIGLPVLFFLIRLLLKLERSLDEDRTNAAQRQAAWLKTLDTRPFVQRSILDEAAPRDPFGRRPFQNAVAEDAAEPPSIVQTVPKRRLH